LQAYYIFSYYQYIISYIKSQGNRTSFTDMNSNQSLINELIRNGYLKTAGIIRAFERVDRIDFVPYEWQDQAYQNYPLLIGYGQTISQPATVAFMLELLQPKRGDKILDVGSGSGWQTALLSDIVGEQGQVIGLEINDHLIELGQSNLKKYGFHQASIVKGNGWQGLPGQAPFDKIIVAAAGAFVPWPLKQQLKINGCLVIPVGQGIQDILVIERDSEVDFTEQNYPGFVFVPLINNRDK